MARLGWYIPRYLLTTIFPYFGFSWLLLSVILFVQQASRYSDIFFSVNVPANLVWQLSAALIPNVIAFTCPMAMLVGTIIGLAKMQGDSELVVIRASGVGNLQIAVPIMLLGSLLSIFAFFVNQDGVPAASALVHNVALQSAIKKLESPLEPGVFNTEVSGYTIYVKSGDIDTGQWKDIFIYSEDPAAGTLRLITSTDGRIDTSGQSSELVLKNASITTIPIAPQQGKYVAESVDEVRLAIHTLRSDLVDKLSSADIQPEELGLSQLANYAASAQGSEKIEAEIIWQRRILLSISPFIFGILGTAIVLRFNRGGHGFGIFSALIVLVVFYLLAFLGEQLARTRTISVFTGSLIPLAASLAAIIWMSFSRRIAFLSGWSTRLLTAFAGIRRVPQKIELKNLFVDLTTGLRDFDLIRTLIKNILLTLAFLSSIFLIFTAFELWKFAGAMEGGIVLLIKYLFFLLPYIYIQLTPSAAMVGTLATYVVKSRQNEIVTWTSAGQSIYRLLLPCFVLMLLVGGLNWVIQERVLPRANQLQEETRTLIRNRDAIVIQSDKYWVANGDRIYSFKLSDNKNTSDEPNETGTCQKGCLNDLSVFEFAPGNSHLQYIYRAKSATTGPDRLVIGAPYEKVDLREGKISKLTLPGGEIYEQADIFRGPKLKPSQLNASEVRRQIATSDSEVETLNLAVALEKKYATIFLPFVIALFTAPFSLSLNRKGKAATVGYAVGLWLLFTGASSVFEQLGLSGYLSPMLSVWSPLVIFSMMGIYLLSRVRT
jgi:LPS export ABC transporter permease LptF